MFIKVNNSEINEITLRKTKKKKKEKKKERKKERKETKLVPSPSMRKQMTFCGN